MGVAAAVGIAAISLLVREGRADRNPEVELSGRYAFSFGSVDGESRAGGDLRLGVRARFRDRRELTHGYRLRGYGVRAEFKWVAGDQGGTLRGDEAFAYFEGDFGYLSVGKDDGSADRLVLSAPVLARGFWSLQRENEFGSGVITAGHQSLLRIPDSGDSGKLTFITPRRWGLRAGLSYAPSADDGDAGFAVEPTGRQHFVEGAVEYRRTLGSPLSGLAVRGSLGFVRRAGSAAPLRGESFAWAASGQLGYAGFAFGWTYLDHGREVLGSGFGSRFPPASAWLRRSWNLGLRYTNGPVQIGGLYGATATHSPLRLEAWGVSLSYRLARNFTLTADYVSFVRHSYPVAGTSVAQFARNDDSLFLLGSVVEF